MMTKGCSTHVLWGWIGMAVLLGAMWAGTATATEKGDSEKGKDIFRESCKHCHGLSGKGDGEMASFLTPPPSNLASEATQAKSDTALKDVIMKGREGTAMAGLEGSLDESQLADLLAYLRSLKP